MEKKNIPFRLPTLTGSFWDKISMVSSKSLWPQPIGRLENRPISHGPSRANETSVTQVPSLRLSIGALLRLLQINLFTQEQICPRSKPFYTEIESVLQPFVQIFLPTQVHVNEFKSGWFIFNEVSWDSFSDLKLTATLMRWLNSPKRGFRERVNELWRFSRTHRINQYQDFPEFLRIRSTTK